MNKLLTEFLGTFFLVTTIALGGSHPLAPFIIGSILMCMVYMGGNISGAHYNPAVTLAVWLRGKISPPLAIQYMLVQLLGAFAAAAVAWLLLNPPLVSIDPATGSSIVTHSHRFLLVRPVSDPPFGFGYMLAAETLFTFALALVVLNVATTKAAAGNSYYGVAIGFTVAVGAACVGTISGGAFNPAVGLGPNLFAMLFFKADIIHSWVYILGPFAGAIIAAMVFRLQHGNTAD